MFAAMRREVATHDLRTDPSLVVEHVSRARRAALLGLDSNTTKPEQVHDAEPVRESTTTHR